MQQQQDLYKAATSEKEDEKDGQAQDEKEGELEGEQNDAQSAQNRDFAKEMRLLGLALIFGESVQFVDFWSLLSNLEILNNAFQNLELEGQKGQDFLAAISLQNLTDQESGNVAICALHAEGILPSSALVIAKATLFQHKDCKVEAVPMVEGASSMSHFVTTKQVSVSDLHSPTMDLKY